MVRRLNISLPERTVELIDRIAGKGQRSALIDRAVLRFVQQESRRAQSAHSLRQAPRDRAARDLQLAEEWFPIETTSEESCPHEVAQARGKSIWSASIRDSWEPRSARPARRW